MTVFRFFTPLGFKKESLSLSPDVQWFDRVSGNRKEADVSLANL